MRYKPVFSEDLVTLDDVLQRLTHKEILATTAMYGPWTPENRFDWSGYENLVREVLRSASVPATNVDTTWAIYNDWELTKNLIWRTAEIAMENQEFIADDRPLVVAGLNTNAQELTVDGIIPALRKQIQEIDVGLKARKFSRIRYMPVPDKRLYAAPGEVKIQIYREMGQMIGDFTDFGLVFFELDIGIPGFGSDFSPDEIAEILAQTPQIREYKSAIISKKQIPEYPYDFRSDVARIQIVETVAPDRIQFSTGNDWFISLARAGKNIMKYGYLLGASQLSPVLFKQWRDAVRHNHALALALELDLQAMAKDFWTPGNVGIYRHYVAIFLAMTGLISYPLPHPQCDLRYRVHPENYFLPLKHALRLGLVTAEDALDIALKFIPIARALPQSELIRRIEWLS